MDLPPVCRLELHNLQTRAPWLAGSSAVAMCGGLACAGIVSPPVGEGVAEGQSVRSSSSVASSSRAAHRCEHGRVGTLCVECEGTGLCVHQRVKSRCKDCGTGYCEHG